MGFCRPVLQKVIVFVFSVSQRDSTIAFRVDILLVLVFVLDHTNVKKKNLGVFLDNGINHSGITVIGRPHYQLKMIERGIYLLV